MMGDSNTFYDEMIAACFEEMPADIKTGYYDAMILYSEGDRAEAEYFCHHLINDIDLNSKHGPVKAALYDCPEMTSLAGSKLSHLNAVFERSTFVFVYVTEEFVNDKWMSLSSESCLMESIESREKYWTVVPVYTKQRSRGLKIPMGLNSLKGINYYQNDQFYRNGVSRLIDDKVHVRVQAEVELKQRQREWIVKNRLKHEIGEPYKEMMTCTALTECAELNSEISSTEDFSITESMKAEDLNRASHFQLLLAENICNQQTIVQVQADIAEQNDGGHVKNGNQLSGGVELYKKNNCQEKKENLIEEEETVTGNMDLLDGMGDDVASTKMIEESGSIHLNAQQMEINREAFYSVKHTKKKTSSKNNKNRRNRNRRTSENGSESEGETEFITDRKSDSVFIDINKGNKGNKGEMNIRDNETNFGQSKQRPDLPTFDQMLTHFDNQQIGRDTLMKSDLGKIIPKEASAVEHFDSAKSTVDETKPENSKAVYNNGDNETVDNLPGPLNQIEKSKTSIKNDANNTRYDNDDVLDDHSHDDVFEDSRDDDGDDGVFEDSRCDDDGVFEYSSDDDDNGVFEDSRDDMFCDDGDDTDNEDYSSDIEEILSCEKPMFSHRRDCYSFIEEEKTNLCHANIKTRVKCSTLENRTNVGDSELDNVIPRQKVANDIELLCLKNERVRLEQQLMRHLDGKRTPIDHPRVDVWSLLGIEKISYISQVDYQKLFKTLNMKPVRCVLIVGHFELGKSSLINAFLKEDFKCRTEKKRNVSDSYRLLPTATINDVDCTKVIEKRHKIQLWKLMSALCQELIPPENLMSYAEEVYDPDGQDEISDSKSSSYLSYLFKHAVSFIKTTIEDVCSLTESFQGNQVNPLKEEDKSRLDVKSNARRSTLDHKLGHVDHSYNRATSGSRQYGIGKYSSIFMLLTMLLCVTSVSSTDLTKNETPECCTCKTICSNDIVKMSCDRFCQSFCKDSDIHVGDYFLQELMVIILNCCALIDYFPQELMVIILNCCALIVWKKTYFMKVINKKKRKQKCNNVGRKEYETESISTGNSKEIMVNKEGETVQTKQKTDVIDRDPYEHSLHPDKQRDTNLGSSFICENKIHLNVNSNLEDYETDFLPNSISTGNGIHLQELEIRKSWNIVQSRPERWTSNECRAKEILLFGLLKNVKMTFQHHNYDHKSKSVKENFPENEDMTEMTSRYKSFDKMPESIKLKMSAYDFAKAGFFYTGKRDEITCFHCGLTLQNLGEDEDPWTEHARHADRCEFLIVTKGQKYINFVKDEESSKHRGRGVDIDFTHITSKYPDMVDASKRLASLASIPNTLPTSPRTMAEAGFFYQDVSKIVQCFSCGVCISDWSKLDVPVIEHARISPECTYIRVTYSSQECIEQQSAGDAQKIQQLDDSQQIVPPDDSQQIEPTDDLQHIVLTDDSPQIKPTDDSQQIKPTDDSQQIVPPDDSQQIEPTDDSQQIVPPDDSQQIEPTDDLQHIVLTDDSQQIKPTDDSQQIEPTDDSQQIVPTDDSQQTVPTDDSQQIELTNDSQQIKSTDNLQQIKPTNDSQQIEQTDKAQPIRTSEDVQSIRTANDVQKRNAIFCQKLVKELKNKSIEDHLEGLQEAFNCWDRIDHYSRILEDFCVPPFMDIYTKRILCLQRSSAFRCRAMNYHFSEIVEDICLLPFMDIYTKRVFSLQEAFNCWDRIDHYSRILEDFCVPPFMDIYTKRILCLQEAFNCWDRIDHYSRILEDFCVPPFMDIYTKRILCLQRSSAFRCRAMNYHFSEIVEDICLLPFMDIYTKRVFSLQRSSAFRCRAMNYHFSEIVEDICLLPFMDIYTKRVFRTAKNYLFQSLLDDLYLAIQHISEKMNIAKKKFLLKWEDQESLQHQLNSKELTRTKVELKSGYINRVTRQDGRLMVLSDQQHLQNKIPEFCMNLLVKIILHFFSSIDIENLGVCQDTLEDENIIEKYFVQKESKEETVIMESNSFSKQKSKVLPFFIADFTTETANIEELNAVVEIRREHRKCDVTVVDLDDKVKISLPPKVFIPDNSGDAENFKDTDDLGDEVDMFAYRLPEKLIEVDQRTNGKPSCDNFTEQRVAEETYRADHLKHAPEGAGADNNPAKPDDVHDRRVKSIKQAKQIPLDDSGTGDSTERNTNLDQAEKRAVELGLGKAKKPILYTRFEHEPVTASLRNGTSSNTGTRRHFYADNINLKQKQNKEIKKKNEDECPYKTLRNLTWLPRDHLPVPRVSITVLRVFEPLNYIFKKMADGETPGPEITMRYELLRLCTLRNYPKVDKPYIIRVAGAGFYYAAEGDEVVCYCCGLRRHGWEEMDVPMDVHRRISANCSFLKRNSDVNVPVPKPDGPDEDRFAFIQALNSTTPEHDNSEDVNSESSISTTTRSYSERNRRPGNFVRDSAEAQVVTASSRIEDTTTGVSTARPKHPEYAVKTLRLNSFDGWPTDLGQTAENMADAGFYYAGVGDCVRCFFCGIGLRHWTPEDNPWIEHARWSRHCVYLNQVKGSEYVQLVHMAMQYTQENEEQTPANGSSNGNQLPAEELDRLLLTDAAQSVLEMGYQPRAIKKAIELVVRQNGREGVTSQSIMEKILEQEEAEDARLNTSLQQLQVTTDPPTGGTGAQAAQTAVAGSCGAAAQGAQAAAASTLTVVSHSALAANTGEAKSTLREVTTSGSRYSEPKQTTNQSTNSKELQKKEHKSKELSTNNKGKTPDPKSIKAENEKLKEQTLCKVCLDNAVCIVFLPCGHLVTCAECAPAMRKCPICRALVKGTVKTFMS